MLTSKHAGCKWSQNDEEVELALEVPTGVKAKDITFVLKPKHITVGVCAQEQLRNLELCHAIVPGDSYWQLDESGASGGRTVSVTLRKARVGVPWRSLALADCPKPPQAATKDSDLGGWTREGDQKKKDGGAEAGEGGEGLSPLAELLPGFLQTVEPGTIAACFMLVVSMLIGLFKLWKASHYTMTTLPEG